MIYYIYKIIFLCGEPKNRYYLGMRTFKGDDIKNDTYKGSGRFCKKYFHKYGGILGKTYLKEILEINESHEINLKRENIIIGDLYKSDPLCMNLVPGGAGCKVGHRVNNKNKCKKVCQYNLDGTLIKVWNSIKDASNTLKINNIVYSCKYGIPKTAGGFVWRYLLDSFDKNEVPDKLKAHPKRRKKVDQFTKDGKFIKTWNSIDEAAGYYGEDQIKSAKYLSGAIHGKAKTYKGYIWKLHDNE